MHHRLHYLADGVSYHTTKTRIKTPLLGTGGDGQGVSYHTTKTRIKTPAGEGSVTIFVYHIIPPKQGLRLI